MKKNLMVVDDSALMRRVICDIIAQDSNFEVTVTCKNGQEALERLRKESFDGVLLDINMPVMDGLQLLEALQKEHIQSTIIMVSTLTTKDADVTIRAMELGATEFITKPENISEARGREFATNLLGIINAVITTGNFRRSFVTPKPVSIAKPTPTASARTARGSKLIALASSTGGPKSLQSVIPYLPANMDAPMVLVQHMPAGFTASMAARLDELSKVHVKEAQDGDVLQKGWVYVAPGGKHMRVTSAGGSHKIKLSDEPAIGGLRPCADVMYESLKDCGYNHVTCVVLTGMGADGTKGINALKSSGQSIYTIAQDKESCVVYGMPKAIAESGVTDEVVSLDKVANSIIKNVGVN